MGLSRAFPIAIILLALLSTTTFSAGTTYPLKVYCFINPGVQTSIGNCISESIFLAAIGLVFSLAIVALTYMIGEVLNMGNLKGWYRKELWETTKSALLIVVIYSSLVLFGGVGAALAGTSTSASSPLLANAHITCPTSATFETQGNTGLEASLGTLYNTAIDSYLQPTLCYSYESFSGIFGLAAGIRTAKLLTVSSWFPIPIIPFPFPEAVFAGLQFGSSGTNIFTSSFLDAINIAEPTPSFLESVITIIIVPTMIQLQFQADLLPLIVTTGIGLFLPLGIFLRAIPFLRGIGGTIIAIAIGLAIVYPIMLVTFNLPITDYFASMITSTSAYNPTTCSGGIFCTMVSNVVNWVPEQGAVIPLAIALKTHDSQAASTGWYIGFWKYTTELRSIFPALNFVNDYSLIMVLQFILFPIDILLGIIAVQAIAKSLGGKLTLGIGKRIKIA